jgi:Zn-dependent protease
MCCVVCFVVWCVQLNLSIAVINMLPVYTLDGGLACPQFCRVLFISRSYHLIAYHLIAYHLIAYHLIAYHLIAYHLIAYHLIAYHLIAT